MMAMGNIKGGFPMHTDDSLLSLWLIIAVNNDADLQKRWVIAEAKLVIESVAIMATGCCMW